MRLGLGPLEALGLVRHPLLETGRSLLVGAGYDRAAGSVHEHGLARGKGLERVADARDRGRAHLTGQNGCVRGGPARLHDHGGERTAREEERIRRKEALGHQDRALGHFLQRVRLPARERAEHAAREIGHVVAPLGCELVFERPEPVLQAPEFAAHDFLGVEAIFLYALAQPLTQASVLQHLAVRLEDPCEVLVEFGFDPFLRGGQVPEHVFERGFDARVFAVRLRLLDAVGPGLAQQDVAIHVDPSPSQTGRDAESLEFSVRFRFRFRHDVLPQVRRTLTRLGRFLALAQFLEVVSRGSGMLGPPCGLASTIESLQARTPRRFYLSIVSLCVLNATRMQPAFQRPRCCQGMRGRLGSPCRICTRWEPCVAFQPIPRLQAVRARIGLPVACRSCGAPCRIFATSPLRLLPSACSAQAWSGGLPVWALAPFLHR